MDIVWLRFKMCPGKKAVIEVRVEYILQKLLIANDITEFQRVDIV